ncbi:MAG: metalloprotease RseP, partial [Bacteroidota bacterium]
MDVLIMASQLILGLCILVLLHEWGHYFTARMFGIRVEKFYVFIDAWGKKIFSFRRGDTEFGLGWLPIGGYVKIAGMVDESVDKEQLAAPPRPDEFRSKPAWQRLIVMIGGVTVNAILG